MNAYFVSVLHDDNPTFTAVSVAYWQLSLLLQAHRLRLCRYAY